MRSVQLAFLLAWGFAAGPAFAKCEGMPWKLGMTPEEVAAITECGPYKSFENGDLETYAGVFNGKAENFQFFFDAGKLRRIGVYLYEGKDVASATQRWVELGAVLTRDFGEVKTAGDIPPNDPAFATNAQQIVAESGKTQMAPAKQPSDAAVFSSFMRIGPESDPIYAVILYFDAPTQD
jgi:hypothetical protein